MNIVWSTWHRADVQEATVDRRTVGWIERQVVFRDGGLLVRRWVPYLAPDIRLDLQGFASDDEARAKVEHAVETTSVPKPPHVFKPGLPGGRCMHGLSRGRAGIGCGQLEGDPIHTTES